LHNLYYLATFVAKSATIMKIYHTISNKEWGGGEQTVLDLSRRQLADGIEVELFCVPVSSIVERFLELQVPIYQVPLRGVLDLKSPLMMAKVLRHSDAQVIHVHNFKEAFTAAYARIIAGRRDIRLVMCRNLTRKAKTTWIYHWLYRQIDCIVFDSQLAMDTFLSTNPDIDRNKLSVIFNGVVLPDHIIPKDVRTEFGIAADEVVVMYHGRLDAEKGLDVLVEAAGLLREKRFRLVLVGRGSDAYMAHLTQLVAEQQLAKKVVFAGFQNPVLSYVAACDIGVLPSIVPEGCSLAAQEHMSQGHPIVATNNGGQREYIRPEQNGLLVSPGNARELAAAIGRLIDDKSLRERLGKQAQTDFDNHLSYENFYKKMRGIYNQVSTFKEVSHKGS